MGLSHFFQFILLYFLQRVLLCKESLFVGYEFARYNGILQGLLLEGLGNMIDGQA